LGNIYSDRIERFSKFLWEENKILNLVGYSDYEKLMQQGIKDSVSSIELASKYIKDTGRILDIGSGGGLPGIIAAIILEKADCVLLDSRRKRTDFLSRAIEYMGLKNCSIVNIRIEEYRERSQFDLVFCRAVGNLTLSLEYSLPFLKKKGIFIANKGKKIEQELKDAGYAFKLLGGNIIERVKLQTGENLVIQKIKKTPDKYPRNTGIPSKRPLLKI